MTRLMTPMLLDDALTLSTGDLKNWGYLGERESGIIKWHYDNEVIFQIQIRSYFNSEKPSIKLRYKIEEISIQYTIKLESMPSNLGKGIMWYFICPKTGKRARKLYLHNKKFVHRNALEGSLYFSQTLSQKGWKLKKVMDGLKAEEEIYEKHFTPYYNGLPTARYKSIMRKVKNAKDLDLEQLLG